MRRALTYFRLQLKRFFKMFPAVFALSAVLFVTMAILLVSFFNQSAGSERDSVIKVGVVGDFDEVYMNIALTTMRDIDASRFSLDLEQIDDEETAREMLLNGDLVAYAKFPKDFVLNAIAGKVEKIVIATAEGTAGLGVSMVNEILDAVSKFLEYSAKSTTAFEAASRDKGLDFSENTKLTGDFSINIVSVVLTRDSMYEVEEIGSAGEEEVQNRLFCGVAVLFLLLWGLTCCQIFVPKKSALSSVMKSKGSGVVTQIAGEYLAYLVFMAATLAVFTIGICIIVPMMHVEDIIADVNIVNMIPGILLPVLAISSMQFFVYEAADGFVGSMLLQFAVGMGTGYIAGCLYPPFFFPRIVQRFASVLPAWIARVHLNEWIYGSPSAKTSLTLVAYFALFIILSAAVRWLRLNRREGGI